MRSPWLIQTCSRSPFFQTPSNSAQSSVDIDEGAAELAMVGALDLAAELLADRLLAVADAEHRHVQLEHDARRLRRLAFIDRGRAAGEDDALGAEVGDALGIGVEGQDLAIDAGLADAARDELRELGTEIEDQDTFGHGCLSRSGIVGRSFGNRQAVDRGGHFTGSSPAGDGQRLQAAPAIGELMAASRPTGARRARRRCLPPIAS